MGNLYAQAEKDLGSAARYFESALDLAPNDPYILTSYGGVEGMRGNYDRARALLNSALEQAPHSPNAQHGLALIHQQLGELDEALALLEGLFAAPESEDPRHQPVYQQARSLYRNIRRRRAEQNHDQHMTQLRAMLDAHSKASGYQFQLQQDRGLETPAKIELAWRYGRSAHVIRYNTDKNAVGLPYLIAHEFEHALLAQEARAAQRNLHFATDQNTERVVYAIIDKDIRHLHKRRDLSPQMIDEVIQRLVRGLCNQLYNAPLDMIIDSRVHEKYPFLHDSEFTWLADEHERNLAVLTDTAIRSIAPKKIYQANVTMNAAVVLFVDDLFNGATDLAAHYRATGLLSTGQRLYALWQEAMKSFRPGDEYLLVDAFARELKLTDWYKWLPDTDDLPQGYASSTRPVGDEGGPTNPRLLKEPAVQMAATMYMVSAMKRFAQMSDAQVYQVVGEIALVGYTGLDYASNEPKYTLRFLPGESFSGLQMMCLMYVGFKRVQPGVDSGIPLDDAYKDALTLYDADMD
jgi:tetratricopeptide (TPR) repeat protein